jgi:hypothetical protein
MNFRHVQFGRTLHAGDWFRLEELPILASFSTLSESAPGNPTFPGCPRTGPPSLDRPSPFDERATNPERNGHMVGLGVKRRAGRAL